MIEITTISLIIFIISITISLYIYMKKIIDYISHIETGFLREVETYAIAVENRDEIRDIRNSMEEIKKLVDEMIKEIRVPAKVSSLKEEAVKIDRRIMKKRLREGELSKTELDILRLLLHEGSKTSSEIRQKLKLSREHIARTLKKLYEKNLVYRDESQKPYRYSILNDKVEEVRKLVAS